MVYVSASTFSHGLSVASQLISVSLGCITEYWPHLSHCRMYSLISAFMLGQKRHSHTLLQRPLTSMWELWSSFMLWYGTAFGMTRCPPLEINPHTRASHHSTFSRDLTQQEGSSCLRANQLGLLPQVIIGLLWFVSEFHRCSCQKLVKLKAFTVWRSPWVFLLETKYISKAQCWWGTWEIYNCKQCWFQTLGCWETFLGVSWVPVLASS